MVQIYVPVPIPPKLLPSTVSESSIDTENDIFEPTTSKNTDPQRFSQEELNDLVRDLGLPKDLSEIIGPRLKDKNLLAPGTTFYWYRKREAEFVDNFSQNGALVFCNNISNLVNRLGCLDYKPTDWRLFIDSSKRSLKAVLLHNGNFYASIPVGHSTYLKENYENLQELLLKDVNTWL